MVPGSFIGLPLIAMCDVAGRDLSTNPHRHSFNAGAQDYALKDAAGKELVEGVRSLHTGKQYLSPQVAKYYL